MKRLGPVIIIEDDQDDQVLLKEIFDKLNYPNEVLFFPDGAAALAYLDNTEQCPFIVLSDINLPRLSGYELLARVRENAKIQLKCVPYLFITTAAERQFVIEAYSASVQGFFVKPHTYEGMEALVVSIMDYWSKCIEPQYV